MSAALIHEAARQMRERAEAATSGRWSADNLGDVESDHPTTYGAWTPVIEADYGSAATAQDAAHIAGMDPAVALAVAAMLESYAEALDFIERSGFGTAEADPEPLAVAKAWLRVEDAGQRGGC